MTYCDFYGNKVCICPAIVQNDVCAEVDTRKLCVHPSAESVPLSLRAWSVTSHGLCSKVGDVFCPAFKLMK